MLYRYYKKKLPIHKYFAEFNVLLWPRAVTLREKPLFTCKTAVFSTLKTERIAIVVMICAN